jgi:hypothetical protein
VFFNSIESRSKAVYLRSQVKYWNLFPGIGVFIRHVTHRGSMLKSAHRPLVTQIVSASIVLAVTLVGGFSAVSLSGVSEVKAEPVTRAGVSSTKGDRLPVLSKGTACSSLGWPHYEQSCQFDMRRQANDLRTVRVISLR